MSCSWMGMVMSSRAGCAFTTPPGMWHAHYNETDQPAHLIPIQDAGLQTYLRALDIQFTFNPEAQQRVKETKADISPATSASDCG